MHIIIDMLLELSQLDLIRAMEGWGITYCAREPLYGEDKRT